MRHTTKTIRGAAIIMLMFFLGIRCANAFTMTLLAYTTYALTGPTGDPLPEGSVVLLVGSADDQIDPMVEFGGGLLSYSFTGDDVFIGMARIDANGLIEQSFEYESSLVNFLYLRFFDAANYPVEGIHAWGTTTVWGVTNNEVFRYTQVDMTLNGPYGVGHTNNFVIIPEADTRNYYGMILLLGLAWLMLAKARHRDLGGRWSPFR